MATLTKVQSYDSNRRPTLYANVDAGTSKTAGNPTGINYGLFTFWLTMEDDKGAKFKQELNLPRAEMRRAALFALDEQERAPMAKPTETIVTLNPGPNAVRSAFRSVADALDLIASYTSTGKTFSVHTERA